MGNHVVSRMIARKQVVKTIRLTTFDKYIAMHIITYLPYTKFYRINREYRSIAMNRIHSPKLSKLFHRILESRSDGHEELLNFAIARLPIKMDSFFTPFMTKEYLVIMWNHKLLSTHTLSMMLQLDRYSHLQSTISQMRDMYQCEEGLNALLGFAIKTQDDSIFFKVIPKASITTHMLIDIFQMNRYTLSKFINVVVQYHNISNIIQEALIQTIASGRNDILNILMKTHARPYITTEMEHAVEIQKLQSIIQQLEITVSKQKGKIEDLKTENARLKARLRRYDPFSL